jgi:hypothetical protein
VEGTGFHGRAADVAGARLRAPKKTPVL